MNNETIEEPKNEDLPISEPKEMSIYEKYGRMMIDLEILQARIGECKKQIADDFNKQPAR